MNAETIAREQLEGATPAPQGLGVERARSRFLLNTASNAIYTAAQVLLNLWLTPYLIGYLGIAAFGMIPLANSIASYMSILTHALHSPLSRFLAIDLEQGDNEAANKTFNTALFGLAAIIVALIPVAVVLALGFPRWFDVPPGWETDTSWLFGLIAATTFITVIGSSFAVSPFIHSRFVATNAVNFAGVLVRVGLIVLLFSTLPARLWFAGGGAVLAAIVTLAGFVWLWRRFTPELRVRPTDFDRSRLQALGTMGGWVIVNTLGALLLSKADLLIINAFFGAALTGGYGSVVQFTLLMEHLAETAATTIRPIILIKYAQQDFEGLRYLASQSVKLLGLGLALPAGLLAGFARPLLAVWLGQEYQYLSVLLVIVIIHQGLNLSVRPLLYVHTAYNKIRWPGIVTLLSGAAGLILGIALAMWGRWGAAGVALAVALAWTSKNALYFPIYTAHIMKLRWWAFFPALLPGVAGTLFVALASYSLTVGRMPASWLALGTSAAVVSIVYGIAVWVLGLNRDDRRLLRRLIGGLAQRHARPDGRQ